MISEEFARASGEQADAGIQIGKIDRGEVYPIEITTLVNARCSNPRCLRGATEVRMFPLLSPGRTSLWGT